MKENKSRIGRAVWNWICSADKRPFLNLSYEDLLKEVENASHNKTLASISKEIGYRRRLKRNKRDQIFMEIKLMEEKISRKNNTKDSVHEIELKEEFMTESMPGEIIDIKTKYKAENSSSQRNRQPNKEIKAIGVSTKTDGAKRAKPIEKSVKEDTAGEILEKQVIKNAQLYEVTNSNPFLYLSIRTVNCLRRNGITNLLRLENYDENKILAMDGMGQGGLAEIKEALLEADTINKRRREIDISEAICTKTESEDRKVDSLKSVVNPEPINHNARINKTENEVQSLARETNVLSINELKEILEEEKILIDSQELLGILINKLDDRQAFKLYQILNTKPDQFYIFIRRCNGETLASIGNLYGISRERIRQKCEKLEKTIKVKSKEINTEYTKRRSDLANANLLKAFEKDLSESGAIGVNVNHIWQSVHQREINLFERISLFQKYHCPICLMELNIHVDMIEKGTGNYGGESYWKNNTVKSLIWCISIRLGKTGIMPKQIEQPRLINRYVQKKFGGQKRAAKQFGMTYTGPIGSRNRTYWTNDRITSAVMKTQKYFCLPPTLMPEQSHLNFYLDIDNDDATKGPSCIAAMKRDSSWEACAKNLGLQVFENLLPEKKSDVEKQIAINFWNQNLPFDSKSEFLDTANRFMNTFWRAPSEPHKYKGVMTQLRCISRLISDEKINLDALLTIQTLMSATSKEEYNDISSSNEGVNEIIDILF